MASHDLFFDAVDLSAVKAEHGINIGLRGEGRGDGNDGDGAAVRHRSVVGAQPLPPPLPPSPPPSAAAAAAAAATTVPAPPQSPPIIAITASELRLAASAALRLAVEAIDALHGLKEVVAEIAGDVRELLEATRRAGGLGGRRRRRSSSSAAARSRLGVRTRSQARRRWR